MRPAESRGRAGTCEKCYNLAWSFAAMRVREQDVLDAVEIEHALVLQQVAVADGQDVAIDVVSWRVVGNGGDACK